MSVTSLSFLRILKTFLVVPAGMVFQLRIIKIVNNLWDWSFTAKDGKKTSGDFLR